MTRMVSTKKRLHSGYSISQYISGKQNRKCYWTDLACLEVKNGTCKSMLIFLPPPACHVETCSFKSWTEPHNLPATTKVTDHLVTPFVSFCFGLDWSKACILLLLLLALQFIWFWSRRWDGVDFPFPVSTVGAVPSALNFTVCVSPETVSNWYIKVRSRPVRKGNFSLLGNFCFGICFHPKLVWKISLKRFQKSNEMLYDFCIILQCTFHKYFIILH